MKVIKIILAVIVALTLVFFGTGLVIKEVKYSSEIEVNNSVSNVFFKFESRAFQKKWIPEIKNIEVVNEVPQKIGSTYNLTIKNKGQEETQMKEKVIAYVFNKKKTSRFTSKSMTKIDDFKFISMGENTTKIIQTTTVRVNSFMLSCTIPWFKSKLKQMNQEYLNRFKKLLEE